MRRWRRPYRPRRGAILQLFALPLFHWERWRAPRRAPRAPRAVFAARSKDEQERYACDRSQGRVEPHRAARVLRGRSRTSKGRLDPGSYAPWTLTWLHVDRARPVGTARWICPPGTRPRQAVRPPHHFGYRCSAPRALRPLRRSSFPCRGEYARAVNARRRYSDWLSERSATPSLGGGDRRPYRFFVSGPVRRRHDPPEPLSA